MVGELAVHTVVRYEALVPSYLDFVRQHRGRRTTDQLENALGRFIPPGQTDLDVP